MIRNGHEQEAIATIGEQAESRRVASADRNLENALAGVAVQSVTQQMARELGLQGKAQGVVVVGLEPDSKADLAGLAEGDVIREMNRQPVQSVQDFEKVVSGLKKDQDVLLLINRRGSPLFITVKA